MQVIAFNRNVKYLLKVYSMKNIPFYDILFIIVTGIILVLINEFGNPVFFSRYAGIIVMIAYFVGKYIGRIELRKKKDDVSSVM